MNPPMPAYNVAEGHSRRGHLRVSDAGGSRRSYRGGVEEVLQGGVVQNKGDE